MSFLLLMQSQKTLKKKALTVKKIRDTIYKRQDGKCLWCDAEITSKMAHLHEKVFRSKGGIISLENSIILCASCHLDIAHGKRRPQWSNTK